MKSWVRQYVEAAKQCRSYSRYNDAKRFMARARGLKAYLIAVGQYED